jgi:hypothetical protein
VSKASDGAVAVEERIDPVDLEGLSNPQQTETFLRRFTES